MARCQKSCNQGAPGALDDAIEAISLHEEKDDWGLERLLIWTKRC